MCVKLFPGDLNPDPYPPHPTSIYTLGATNTCTFKVIITPKVYSEHIIKMQLKINFNS